MAYKAIANGVTHKDLIIGGQKHKAVYAGDKLIWKKEELYGLGEYPYVFNPIVETTYNGKMINEFNFICVVEPYVPEGQFLNEAFAVSNSSSDTYFRAFIGCTAIKIKKAKLVPAFRYNGEIIYSGDETGFKTFELVSDGKAFSVNGNYAALRINNGEFTFLRGMRQDSKRFGFSNLSINTTDEYIKKYLYNEYNVLTKR